MAAALNPSGPGVPGQLIAGYRPWTDKGTGDLVNYLFVDAIQADFEGNMEQFFNPYVPGGRETCNAFTGTGTTFWNSLSPTEGEYYRDLPSWKGGTSATTSFSDTEELVQVFFDFYGSENFLTKIIQAAFDASTVTVPTIAGCATGFVVAPNFESNFCNQFCNVGDSSGPVNQCWVSPEVGLTRDFPQRTLGGGNIFGTSFGSGNGACVGYEKIAKNVAAFTGFLMETLSLMQKAIDLVEEGCSADPYVADIKAGCQGGTGCGSPCYDALSAWDSAVAVYAGSTEGDHGVPLRNLTPFGGAKGFSLYHLAQAQCGDFGTCGSAIADNGVNALTIPEFPQNFDITQPANVNMRIMQFFTAGAQAIYYGDTTKARQFKRLVADKTIIAPLQGMIKNYWKMGPDPTTNYAVGSYPLLAGSNRDEHAAEGVALYITLLPRLWMCSKKAFNKIRDREFFNLGGTVTPWPQTIPFTSAIPASPGTETFWQGRWGLDPSKPLLSNMTSFDIIKRAFECNYQCLGITCPEVGELFEGDHVLGLGPRQNTVKCDDRETSQAGLVCQKLGGLQYNNRCKPFKGSPGDQTYRNYRNGKIAGPPANRIPGFWLA